MALNLGLNTKILTSELQTTLGTYASDMTASTINGQLNSFRVELQNLIKKINNKPTKEDLQGAYALIMKLRELLTGQEIKYRVYLRDESMGTNVNWAGFELNTAQLLENAGFSKEGLYLNTKNWNESTSLWSQSMPKMEQTHLNTFNDYYKKITQENWVGYENRIKWGRIDKYSDKTKRRLFNKDQKDWKEEKSLSILSKKRGWVINQEDYAIYAPYQTTNATYSSKGSRKIVRDLLGNAIKTRRTYSYGNLVESLDKAVTRGSITKDSFFIEDLQTDNVVGFMGGDVDRYNNDTSWQIKSNNASIMGIDTLKKYLTKMDTLMATLNQLNDKLSSNQISSITDSIKTQVQQNFIGENNGISNMLDQQMNIIIENLVKNSIGQFATPSP